MEEKFSFILFLITIIDLYFNYNSNEFPKYHKARIISDILSLLAVLLPFFLIILVCCMGCFIYFQWFNNDTAQKCTFAITIICILLMILSLTKIISFLYLFIVNKSKILFICSLVINLLKYLFLFKVPLMKL